MSDWCAAARHSPTHLAPRVGTVASEPARPLSARRSSSGGNVILSAAATGGLTRSSAAFCPQVRGVAVQFGAAHLSTCFLSFANALPGNSDGSFMKSDRETARLARIHGLHWVLDP